ncbi:MAG: DegV family protein [Chloroflexota bacterium]
MNTAIVTDSTADIPPEFVERYQIHIIPAILIIEGESQEDGKGISRESFYQQLSSWKTPPKTAAPPSGAFETLYEKLLSGKFSSVISIHAAGALSGIYNAACIASQAFPGKVQVIDSNQVSLGLGFQVLAAAETQASGEPLIRILEIVESVKRRVRVMALLNTLEYVRRSGRVSWARAAVGELLSLKPLIELRHGHVSRLGLARTWQNGVNRLSTLLSNLGPLERLAVMHSNAETEAKRFLKNFKQKLPTPPIIVNVTTIIGSHAGPHGLGFTALPFAPS